MSGEFPDFYYYSENSKILTKQIKKSDKKDYNFEYCIIDGSFDYLIENHLIYIYYTENSDSKVCISLYKKIMTSFKDARTKKFINLYFGNNAINVKELQNVLPIYNDILNLK